ncbi:MAG: methyltransferase domain-containing protein [Thermomicrobia bacterium]|nr:methyltransferase domain-containing protein [Thermomicrobia bacterium]
MSSEHDPTAPSSDPAQAFYDQLAAQYHLIYGDWRGRAVPHQGAVVDALLRVELGPGVFAVLDCACGIGTQAIGLALLGHRVHATDLSPRAVARAAQEAASFGVALTVGVADFRSLTVDVPGSFDAVLAADNAVAHLLTDDDLVRAAENMRAKLRSGGVVVLGIRDYDQLVRERPHVTSPVVMESAEGRRIIFQVWDWAADGRSYQLELFILTGEGERWTTRSYTSRVRALLRKDLERALRAAGFRELQWHEPGETRHHQPLITARNP